MKKYYIGYTYKGTNSEMFVLNGKKEIKMYPSHANSDFICSIMENLYLHETEEVKLVIDENMPDTFSRQLELYNTLYNLIPKEKKPIGD